MAFTEDATLHASVAETDAAWATKPFVDGKLQFINGERLAFDGEVAEARGGVRVCSFVQAKCVKKLVGVGYFE